MKQILHNRWLLLVVAILGLANLGLVAYHFLQGRPGGDRRSSSDWFYRELGLSSEQEAQFRSSKDSFMKEMRPRWSASRKAKDSLYARMGDSTLGDSALTTLTAHIAALNRASDEQMFRHFRELRKRCSPTQQLAFDTLVPKLMSRNRGGRPATSQTSR